MHWFNKKRNQKGFTLVELLIVIAVLGIIAAIGIPRMTGITDTMRVRSDLETAKRLAKQVEVKVLTGDLTPSSSWATITTSDFGEDFPIPQFEKDSVSAYEIEYTEGGVAVGYNNITDKVGDIVEDEYTGSNGNPGVTELLFSDDIGDKIE